VAALDDAIVPGEATAGRPRRQWWG